MSARILLVEDEAITAIMMKVNLTGMGFTVSDTCAKGEDAVESVRSDGPDLILMDINLVGEIDGIEAARRILQDRPVPVIFVTGYSDGQYYDRAMQLDPAGYLIKPVVFSELERAIRDALSRD